MLNSILGFLLALIVPFANIISFPFTGMVSISSYQVQQQAGGFIKGVCHQTDDYDMLLGANIGYIREDVPFPFDENGNISYFYNLWKQEMQGYIDNGIKVFVVTPYPKEYIAMGMDIRNEEGIEKRRAVAEFFVKDLRGIASAYQITNEMGVDRFTSPLTIDEAALFIGEQLKAMAPLVEDELLGYNLGGPGFYTLSFKMLKYNKYCDYIGCDLYLGSFENVIKNIDTFFSVLNLVRAITQKPIIMTEFGYIGYGEPKTEDEKKEILRSYGFESEEDVRKDVNTFISRLPYDLREEFETLYSDRTDEEKFDLLFHDEYANHIYRELQEGTGLYGFPHTPEGQADFYAYMIPRLRALPWCIGAFIYMWHDSEHCYVCGQSDCPVETGWGIVDGQGNPKPAYYAVQKAFE